MIWFNSKKAREQLIKNGVVVTARTMRKQTGRTTAVYRDKNGDKVEFALVVVSIVDESCCVDTLTHRPVLEKYLNISGFKTVNEWEDEICIMNRGNRMPIYLKLVKVEVSRLLI